MVGTFKEKADMRCESGKDFAINRNLAHINYDSCMCTCLGGLCHRSLSTLVPGPKASFGQHTFVNSEIKFSKTGSWMKGEYDNTKH